MSRPYGAPSVVVIDDDRDQADLLAILLEFEGYKVYATVDPHEGLLWIQNHLPDLVLLDFAMPQMSGAELARLLKESPQTRHVKVIIESAMPEAEVRRSLPGCDGFLAKPFHLHELIEAVGSLLPTRAPP